METFKYWSLLFTVIIISFILVNEITARQEMDHQIIGALYDIKTIDTTQNNMIMTIFKSPI